MNIKNFISQYRKQLSIALTIVLVGGITVSALYFSQGNLFRGQLPRGQGPDTDYEFNASCNGSVNSSDPSNITITWDASQTGATGNVTYMWVNSDPQLNGSHNNPLIQSHVTSGNYKMSVKATASNLALAQADCSVDVVTPSILPPPPIQNIPIGNGTVSTGGGTIQNPQGGIINVSPPVIELAPDVGITGVSASPNPYTTKGTTDKITFTYTYNNGMTSGAQSQGLVDGTIYQASDYDQLQQQAKANAKAVLSWSQSPAQYGKNTLFWDGKDQNSNQAVADGSYVFVASFPGTKQMQGPQNTPINVSVTYTGLVPFTIQTPTPNPPPPIVKKPSPTPSSPIPAPKNPSPAPNSPPIIVKKPSPSPNPPTPIPNAPSPTPSTPTPSPSTPTPSPTTPSPTFETPPPTPSPSPTPTSAPTNEDKRCAEFNDISVDDQDCQAWTYARTLGITGKPGNIADPNGLLQRDEIAKIIQLIFFKDSQVQCSTNDKPFLDMSGSDWSCSYVLDLKNKKVVTGYLEGSDAGKYHPERPVSRAEFAALLSRNLVAKQMAQLPVDVSDGHNFDDVPSSLWYSRYAALFYKLKIWQASNFYATQYVHRSELVDALNTLHQEGVLP